MFPKRFIIAALSLVAAAATLPAQQKQSLDCAKVMSVTADHANMDHAAHSKALADCASAPPTLPGQAAFGAIGEVVRILEADPNTDWSKVNVEALRQHLIDMDEVIMHSTVEQRPVAGGLRMDISGTGRTAAAIKRMVINHAAMLDQDSIYRTVARETPNGATLTVTAKRGGDARAVAQIRGLGFAGLMTEGDHHVVHHIALARGETPHTR